MTGLRPFAIIKAPVSGAAVNAEAALLSKRPTPQANEDDRITNERRGNEERRTRVFPPFSCVTSSCPNTILI